MFASAIYFQRFLCEVLLVKKTSLPLEWIKVIPLDEGGKRFELVECALCASVSASASACTSTSASTLCASIGTGNSWTGYQFSVQCPRLRNRVYAIDVHVIHC